MGVSRVLLLSVVALAVGGFAWAADTMPAAPVARLRRRLVRRAVRGIARQCPQVSALRCAIWIAFIRR